ncbi:MAG: DUF4349 domain-containing protein, partial [Candidatus Nanohaloarchaea archaeon]
MQEATFQIETDDVAAAADRVTTAVDRYDGYVQERRTADRPFARTVEMTVRIPDGRFTAFTGDIRDGFEVESSRVRNYRISIQRELDELDILNRTLTDYERIRARVLDGETTTEELQLLADLTE